MAYPVSAAFNAAAVAANTRTATRVDVLDAGTVITAAIPVISGSVTVEANQPVRRHGSLIIEGLHDEIDPYGIEVVVYGGLYLPAGTPITIPEAQTVQDDGTVLELCPMGTFGIEVPETADDGLVITDSFEIYDRAASIQARRLPTPYLIAAGTNVGTAIQALINSRRPGLTYVFESTTATTPDVLLAEQADPWEAAQQLAAGAGMELFFDPLGVLVLRSIPAVDADNVDWQYVEGDVDHGIEGTCKLWKVAKKRTSEGVFSHAIATGETTDNTAPVRGDAYDDNSASPTYYLGRFGDRPTWLRSPYIRTQAQADSAAAGLRNRTSGIAEGLTLEAGANPAADADDTALVQRARINLDAVYTFDSLTNTLGPEGGLQASTRTRRIA